MKRLLQLCYTGHSQGGLSIIHHPACPCLLPPEKK